MKLEASLKHFSPQGLAITDSSKSTSPDRITGTDVMAALGSTASKARFGLWAFLGKNGISAGDEQKAVQELARMAMDDAPKNVRKAAGSQFGNCMLILARFAFTEYSRSAASSSDCPNCKGKGLVDVQEQVVRYPGYIGADGEEKIAPWVELQTVKKQCQHCEGKGTLSARCRCKGIGRVLDRKATSEQGAPVFKECERCTGKGFASMPSTNVHKAILSLVPDLHVRTWTRNWKPFYDGLVQECHWGEGKAEIAFERATKF